MKLRYPKYYERFSCIAGACEDTCCAGWEIDIDDESYEAYMRVSGEFGIRLRENIKEYQPDEEDRYESHGFLLTEEKRCPFLNEKNLCDIILELGEDAICYVCTNTPRNFLEYGGAREISISPSCAEAGRLIFGSQQPVCLVEKEIQGQLDFEESPEELGYAEMIRRARDVAIALLQNRARGIEQRICDFLLYAKWVQDGLNRNEPALPEALLAPESAGKMLLAKEDVHGAETCLSGYEAFQKRMESFGGLDSINDEWELYLERLRALFLGQDGREQYESAFCRYREYIRQESLEYQAEQLMVYYAFLFLARSVDDGNFWGKAQFCVSSFLMQRDMQLERFYQNGGHFSVVDCVDIARIYAKEVEHSQENLEYLEEEFLFEDIYRYEALRQQVGWLAL